MSLRSRYPRLVAFILLAVLTVCGAWLLLSGDWRAALGQWRGRLPIVAAVLGLRIMDLALDGLIWWWLLRSLGIRLRGLSVPLVYLAGYAGLLLPAQLGRFVRSDAIVRLGAGPFLEAAKAEAVLVFLSGVSAVALLAAAVAYAVSPVLAPVALAAVAAAFLFFAEGLFRLLSKTPIRLPAGYWWHGKTFLMVLLCMLGWTLAGVQLFLIAKDLPGGITLWQALIVAPSNLVLGSSTGLPGGIGAVEGLLGASLSFLQVSSSDLPLAVAVFRLLTFWIWIPAGWLALLWVNRLAAGNPGRE